MNVYVVRYWEAVCNVLKQYNTIDEDLTELGLKQAEKLRYKILYYNIFSVIKREPYGQDNKYK